MDRKIIQTADAPAAVGPYSQAVALGEMLYTSGQIALDPATGKMVEGDVQAQTEQVFRNLEAVLVAGGASLASVVKATVFLKDMNDFAAFNAVYAQRFGDARPARSTVEVARLPLDALVEIEAIAVRGA